MSETIDERFDRVDQRLTQMEEILHNLDERTASLPAVINRVLELMGDFRHHTHETGGPNVAE